jgi:glutathione peroxidase
MKYRNLLFPVVFLSFVMTSSLYDFTVNGIDGSAIPLSNFRGHRILIVNIATQSQYADQLEELVQLRQIYGDSLVILAFPSNSFGREPGTNSQISDSVRRRMAPNFLLAGKIEVAGVHIHPLYAWLSDSAQNGTMGNVVIGDFQKYLVNAEGRLVGVFAPSVRPLSDELQNAIKMN